MITKLALVGGGDVYFHTAWLQEAKSSADGSVIRVYINDRSYDIPGHQYDRLQECYAVQFPLTPLAKATPLVS